MTFGAGAAPEVMHGTVLHCSAFGCVVRLPNGRLASLAAQEPGFEVVRKLANGSRHPRFPFLVQQQGRRMRLVLAAEVAFDPHDTLAEVQPPSLVSDPLERKIAEFLRQTAEWDARGPASDLRRPKTSTRAVRISRFEKRLRDKQRHR